MIENKKNLTDNDSLMYRPFQTDQYTITRDHYSTSLDPRGYIPVYEYVINNAPVMWDRETGYVHFTGIWKALGNSKSDIVKMVDSNPELGTKKIRGGFLRIQGTWIPYDYAHLLCKRTAWHIRHELVPIFGPKFPMEALDPEHQDYGCLLLQPKSNPNHQKKSNTTMRQKPYVKQQRQSSVCQKRKRSEPSKKKKKPKHDTMSLNRLLNQSKQEDTDDDMMTLSDASSLSSLDSPTTTPSPTFRVVQTYPPHHEESWPKGFCQDSPLLPPIQQNPSQHYALPSIKQSTDTWPAQHVAQDIIDTISATILLQRLSQDNGERPFRPMESSVIPSKVIVGHQEFTICWD
ncbi:transcription regulator HTH, apses-type DNA-binding domain-containing protein [Choanephora cucurbitarum]|nr:transcription regulator HTH, apses-type DNA-binding domain-containing protein [Choanephora cucurbitarum]